MKIHVSRCKDPVSLTTSQYKHWSRLSYCKLGPRIVSHSPTIRVSYLRTTRWTLGQILIRCVTVRHGCLSFIPKGCCTLMVPRRDNTVVI